MGLVKKIQRAPGHSADSARIDSTDSLTDGALDTLGCVLRTMGSDSFPIAADLDADLFPSTCMEFALHVENGSAIPGFDIPASADGSRQWPKVRRFYIDRRRAEKAFVTARLGDYRDIVDDLVDGLRLIGQRDQTLEASVRENLEVIESAVGTGVVPEIKQALAKTVNNITQSFQEQKKEYELQISELNGRMSNLRQDLVQAREDMKRDPLTDAYNRGAFDTAIAQSINMQFILHQPVTLVFIDLDNFKEINDSFGHTAGDETLRVVSDCLARSFIRRGDFVARYGGDEFAVILNDTTAANSQSLITRFMDCLAAADLSAILADRSLTCSIGYTEIGNSDSVESLLERADKGLYEAKAAGRNTAKFVPAASSGD